MTPSAAEVRDGPPPKPKSCRTPATASHHRAMARPYRTSTSADSVDPPARSPSLRSQSRFKSEPTQAFASQAMPVPSSSRSEEHTSELQSLMRISYAVLCLKKKQQLIK